MSQTQVVKAIEKRFYYQQEAQTLRQWLIAQLAMPRGVKLLFWRLRWKTDCPRSHHFLLHSDASVGSSTSS
jgi:hypothetical protein